jgi:hypothetical protein
MLAQKKHDCCVCKNFQSIRDIICPPPFPVIWLQQPEDCPCFSLQKSGILDISPSWSVSLPLPFTPSCSRILWLCTWVECWLISLMKFRVFWDVLPCSQRDSLITLMMEAVRTSETSVDIYLTTRQYIPEDSELHTCCCENLKSHISLLFTCVGLSLMPCGSSSSAPVCRFFIYYQLILT